MATATRSTTKDALLEGIASGTTGRLCVGAGSAEIAVFLLDGHIVATRASDDTAALVERLGAQGHLPDSRVAQLRQMQEMSASLLGRDGVDPILRVLFEEVATAVIEEALATRFDENLARFVGNRGQPRFDDDVTPWAVNIQTGHDSQARVEQAAALWALSQLVSDDQRVAAGSAPSGDPFATQVMQAAGSGDTVAQVASRLDLPDLVARAMIARALQDGVLVEAQEEEAEDASLDELEAFSGSADQHRGGHGGGRFVTQSHNLDRVELVDLGGDDAAGKTFSAPTMSEDEALEKIQVANDVLGALAQAVDDEKGDGQGRVVIQLLVDGRPRDFVPLLDGIKVGRTGLLPRKGLLANLRQRPESEQRRLLNKGLLDLLDRALDRVADDVEEDRFDEVLAQVMGYRQRMGL